MQDVPSGIEFDFSLDPLLTLGSFLEKCGGHYVSVPVDFVEVFHRANIFLFIPPRDGIPFQLHF